MDGLVRSALWATSIRTAGVIRLAQLLPPIVLAIFGGFANYQRPGLAVAAFVVSSLWAALLFRVGVRDTERIRWWVAADVVSMSAVGVAVGFACAPDRTATWDNWSNGPVVGAIVLGSIVMSPRLAWELLIIAVCFLSYLGGTAHAWSNLLAIRDALLNGVSILAFSAAAILFSRFMNRMVRDITGLHNEASARMAEKAAVMSVVEERERQFRVLHDTALATLSLIARGGIDANSAEIRDRAGRDAVLLRNFSMALSPTERQLPSLLELEVRDAVSIGVNATLLATGEYEEIPADVAAAIAMATREALNNVAKHAQAGNASVALLPQERGVLVMVKDDGRGFDETSTLAGHGLARSIAERLEGVGGVAKVTSTVGEGTMVELRWPAA